VWPVGENGAVTVPRALRPLLSGRTYRRGIHLLLGGVILLPYALLGSVFWQMWTHSDTPRAATALLLLAAGVIGAVPAFLSGTRALGIVAARSLLEVDPPEPGPTAALDREARLRAAMWFGLHLLCGGLVGVGLVIAIPPALIFIARLVGVDEARRMDGLGLLTDHPAVLTAVGVGLLVAVVYAVAGLGALAAVMAPTLLGPSPSERIAALEARTLQLAERNRLARELHDSVGHALTVATLQAGAARGLLDNDPEFARRALAAIEETARTAMDDLDHVLGLLRRTDGDDDLHHPQRTLNELGRLIHDTRTAGVSVKADVDGSTRDLPAAVSREGYRIVQEGLTNAARHARGQLVTLRLTVCSEHLQIELVNALNREPDRARRGRGVDGMRERVVLLGGSLTAGPDGRTWRIRARLPIRGATS
jgi:signal transduction histidine kinase